MRREHQFDIGNIPPEQLGLKDKEGRIRNVDLAQAMAEAGKILREMANNPNLTEETRNKFLELAEKSEEEAYKRWIKEHEEELLKKYQEERMELLKRTLVKDPQVAEEMAWTFYPYLLLSETKGLSEKDKQIIFEEGEKAAENKFRTIAPDRIKELDAKIKQIEREMWKSLEEYQKNQSELYSPERRDYSKESPDGNYLFPQRCSDESSCREWKRREEKILKLLNDDLEIFCLYSKEEEIENFKNELEQLTKDYQELLPRFEELAEKEEKLIESLKEEYDILEKKSSKKGLFESKDKFKEKKKNLEKKLEKIRYHERILDYYRRWTIGPIKNFLENTPRLFNLLSQAKESIKQKEEISEIRENLYLRLTEGEEALKNKLDTVKKQKLELEGKLEKATDKTTKERLKEEIQEKEKEISNLESQIEKLENL